MAKRNIVSSFCRTTLIDLRVGCNNACRACKVSKRAEDLPDVYELMEEISREASEDYKEIIFCGGEPTIFPHLSSLIRRAKDTGFNRIKLETNGRMFAYETYARRILDAGLSDISVLIPAARAETYAAICGPPEGFQQLNQGIQNIKRLKPEISLHGFIPIDSMNRKELSEIVRHGASLGLSHISILDRQDFSESVSDQELTLDELRASLNEGKKLKIGVSIEGRLSDIYRKELSCTAISPKTDEIDDRTAVMFCPTTFVGATANPEMLEALIRATFSCNQICNYCWVDRETPNPDPEEIIEKIEQAGRDKLFRLSFSGGEPTINPRLPDFIKAAKQAGIRETVLHTNAVKLADPAFARTLDTAGLDIAYVTMLASNAKLSDSITRTEGTFRKTVSGVQNLLLHTDIFTFLHFVITKDNYTDLPAFIEFAEKTFISESGEKIPLTFSYVAPPKPDVITHVPRYSEAIPYLKRAMDLCEAKGIPFGGNEGLKSLPPCVLEGDQRYFRFLMPLNRESTTTDFVKKPECAECDFDHFCYGVRQIYALSYGLDEFNPIRVNDK